MIGEPSTLFGDEWAEKVASARRRGARYKMTFDVRGAAGLLIVDVEGYVDGKRHKIRERYRLDAAGKLIQLGS